MYCYEGEAMMSKKLFLAIAFISVCAVGAQSNTLTPDGTALEPTHDYASPREGRHLVWDGDFEDGTCLEGNSSWTCTTDNDCDWITDLVPLGLWNYSGAHIAWLGGFCGEATEYTSICQDFEIGVCPSVLLWFWMAYVNEGGSRVYVTIDDDVVWEKILTPADHLLDYQQDGFSEQLSGVHTICFNYDRNGAYGDNYFFDWVTGGVGPTATEPSNFSTFKSLY